MIETTEQVSAATPTGALSCRIFRSFAGLDNLRVLWDEACLRAGGSVYMTYDWLRIWWQFYGEDTELRLFVFFSGDRIEAMVPIYIANLGWGPLRFRVARLVGANIPPKVFDPPVPESCAAEVMPHVIDQLFQEDRCDLLSFGPTSELQPMVKYLDPVCAQRSNLVRQPTVVTGIHSVFHLPATMAQYFDSLTKKERKNRQYSLRLLERECQSKIDLVCDPASISEEFERFAEQHRQQWSLEGKAGHFGAWPRGLDYNRALVRAQAERGRLRFIRILANNEVIASQYTFAFGGRYFWELPSRAVDPKWDRFSLGPTGLVTLIDQAIKEGVARVEGGLGHYDYKLRLGAKEYTTLTFRIVSAKPIARVRFALFSILRTCWSYLYHKLWYRRLMPRLPRACWRPQSERWLQMDF